MSKSMQLRKCPRCDGPTALTIHIPPKNTRIAEAVCRSCGMKLDYRTFLFKKPDAESKAAYKRLLSGIVVAVNSWVDEQR